MKNPDQVMDEALQVIERSDPARAEVFRRMLAEKAERRKLRNIVRSPLAVVAGSIAASTALGAALIATGYATNVTMVIPLIPALVAGVWYIFFAKD